MLRWKKITSGIGRTYHEKKEVQRITKMYYMYCYVVGIVNKQNVKTL